MVVVEVAREPRELVVARLSVPAFAGIVCWSAACCTCTYTTSCVIMGFIVAIARTNAGGGGANGINDSAINGGI
eukprot:1477888-Ditylum_brightwellii.AAC.1